MTWGDAFGATLRPALIFALAFIVLGFLLDAALGRAFDPVQRIATVAIATAIYWTLVAWRKRG